MPFINVKTNKTLTPANKLEVKAELGEAISLFPGKSENWLMCEIEDGKAMFFGGSDAPCVFAEVKLFGSVNDACAENFTAKFCDIMAGFGIPANRVYVRYEGGTSWGWNNSNF